MPDPYPAIEDHAVIGDLHTVALVPTDGTIDWRCLPRFESPAVFASLPDADRGGSFAVRCEAVRTRQQYLVGAEYLVTLCDLGILVDQATEPVPAENLVVYTWSRWLPAPGSELCCSARCGRCWL